MNTFSINKASRYSFLLVLGLMQGVFADAMKVGFTEKQKNNFAIIVKAYDLFKEMKKKTSIKKSKKKLSDKIVLE